MDKLLVIADRLDERAFQNQKLGLDYEPYRLAARAIIHAIATRANNEMIFFVYCQNKALELVVLDGSPFCFKHDPEDFETKGSDYIKVTDTQFSVILNTVYSAEVYMK